MDAAEVWPFCKATARGVVPSLLGFVDVCVEAVEGLGGCLCFILILRYSIPITQWL